MAAPLSQILDVPSPSTTLSRKSPPQRSPARSPDTALDNGEPRGIGSSASQGIAFSADGSNLADVAPLLPSPTINDQSPIAASNRTRNGGKRPNNIQTQNGTAAARHSAQPSPHAPKHSSKLSHPPQMAQEPTLEEFEHLDLPTNTYVIPLSLPTRIYNQYTEVLQKYVPDQIDLVQKASPSLKDQNNIQRMISELEDILVHPDLVDATALDSATDCFKGELNYGRMSSSKFGFLYNLLSSIRYEPLNIAIVAKEETSSILSRFLESASVSYWSPRDDQKSTSTISQNLKVAIFSSNHTDTNSITPVDYIIPLDCSYHSDGILGRGLRGSNAKTIYPWIYNSPEHIRASIPSTISESDTIKILSGAIVQYCSQLGRFRNHWAGAESTRHQDIEDVAKWIKDGGDWPLNEIPKINLAGLEPILRPVKRQLDEIDEDESPPRRRLKTEEVVDGVVPLNGLPRHEETMTLEEQLASLRSKVQSQDQLISNHVSTNAENEAVINRIQRSNEDLERKLSLQTKISISLMNACDDALNLNNRQRWKVARAAQDRNTAQKLRDKAIEDFQFVQENLAKRIAECDDLKIRLKIAAAAVPEGVSVDPAIIADPAVVQTLETEIAVLKQKTTNLEKKAKSAGNDRAYAFKMYQDASSAAASSANEIQTLQAEIDRLTPLAANATQMTVQAAENSELETYRQAYEKTLAEKEELEEQLRRGNSRQGMSTRGQSAAPGSSRSPRVVSPSRSRATSRQPISRASSPAGRMGAKRLPGRLGDV